MNTRLPHFYHSVQRAVLAALLGGVMLGSLPAAEPTPVIATRTVKKPIFDTVEALGTLRADETVSLAPNVTETIRAIHFEDGDEVKKDQILVELTNAEESAELQTAQSTLDEAKRQFERVKPLSESGAASGSLVDQRRREYETAKAQIEVIKSRLQDRLIVAPFDGVVGIRNISPGALVQPGVEITTLDAIDPMKLDFSVPAVFLQDLRRGLPVVATSPAFKDKKFSGTVTSIDSRVDPVTRSIMVRAKLPNPEHLLKPGLLMRVSLQSRPREALVVPEHAVISQNTEQFVYLLDPGQQPPVPRQQKVELGTRMPGEVEILSGLKESDVVVTHGKLRLKPGQPVEIQGYEQKGKPLTKCLNEDGKPAKEG